ncbi:hypothetical protein [Xanthomonas sp. 3058]|uniref:hypothetical protein n=1 Tax=Xanthomonas sp. 3058 TaxID=3035314 RepID=UPI001619372F|nr:hypothetical protein [Xanthomonas sp. 3058]MBB5866478.1 hypothetical protein [Xanthomonas sp. 3058]
MTATELRQQRLERLYQECRKQVVSQLIGPFGLNPMMFEDRNGGNVTTLHNFERDDDSYVATREDKAMHKHSKDEYDRSQYVLDTKAKAHAAGHGDSDWNSKRDAHLHRGMDEYTGKAFETAADGSTTQDGTPVSMELDHAISLKEFHEAPKNHLALGKVTIVNGQDVVVTSTMAGVVNDEANLSLTNKSLNASKGGHRVDEWVDDKLAKAEKAGKSLDFDPQAVQSSYDRARDAINAKVDTALLKKQAAELANTSLDQAKQMGVRQAMGVLLTELVNSLFVEFKELIRKGVKLGKALLDDLRQRLSTVAINVAKKVPEAFSALFEGGISGFASNLLTFLLNNVLSTAKRYVTAIREGLLGLFHAFRMIAFPPEHLSEKAAFQAGLKMLSTVLMTTIGILLGESVANFLLSIPVLLPVANVIAPVLVGILTGLLSALMAYQIDAVFERRRLDAQGLSIEAMLADAKYRKQLSEELADQTSLALSSYELNLQSLQLYQAVGEHYIAAVADGAATLVSLTQGNTRTRDHVVQSNLSVQRLQEGHDLLEDFLNREQLQG